MLETNFNIQLFMALSIPFPPQHMELGNAYPIDLGLRVAGLVIVTRD
jgi:hypothetical protein